MDAATATALTGGAIGFLAGVGALVKVFVESKRTLRADALTECYKLIDQQSSVIVQMKADQQTDRLECDVRLKRVEADLVEARTQLHASEQQHMATQLRSERRDGENRMLREALRTHGIEVRPWTDQALPGDVK